jgi:hypothetical protein
MGTYASIAVRDLYGNIIGYRSTTTGEIVEVTGAASPRFQELFAQSQLAKEKEIRAEERRRILDEVEVFKERYIKKVRQTNRGERNW